MIPNLLQITTIPIEIEIKVTNAKLEHVEEDVNPKGEMRRTDALLTMKSEPMKLNIDTYQARKSLGFGHMKDIDMLKQTAQEGWSKAFEGTSKAANEGDQLARGVKPSEIALNNARAGATVDTIMDFLPKEDADINFQPTKLNFEYEKGALDFDWDVHPESPLKYVPGNVEFIIHDRPRVEIEYVGDPLYVPPSANPNYEPTLYDLMFN